MTSVKRHIAVIGGAGALGGGLALRWAEAGHKMVIGSRSAGRACDAAAEIRRSTSNESVSGESNQAAAAAADVVVHSYTYNSVIRYVEDRYCHAGLFKLEGDSEPESPPIADQLSESSSKLG